jgi:hypothetical protein
LSSTDGVLLGANYVAAGIAAGTLVTGTTPDTITLSHPTIGASSGTGCAIGSALRNAIVTEIIDGSHIAVHPRPIASLSGAAVRFGGMVSPDLGGVYK